LLPERGISKRLKWNPCDAFLEQKSSLWADTVEFIEAATERARGASCC
jgi:hypothetical protein